MTATQAHPAGTMTFLFTDIEGSTRAWGQQGRAMSAAMTRHDAIVRTACAEKSGHVFRRARARRGATRRGRLMGTLSLTYWPN